MMQLGIFLVLAAAIGCHADEAECLGDDCTVEQDVIFLQTALRTDLQDGQLKLEEAASAAPTTTTLDAAAVTGVTGNEAGDLELLISACIMNGGVALFFALVTSVLRSLYPTMMSWNSISGRVPDTPETDWTSWMWATLKNTRAEQVKYAGLDHGMLMEYTVFCMRLCLWIGVPALFITGPLNVFTGHGEAEKAGDTLSMLGINNVRDGHPWMYKVYGAFTIYVVFITQREIFRSMRIFCEFRSHWLRDLEDPQATTVMVEGIPEECQSEEKVREFFSDMFSPEAVKEVNIVQYIPDLEGVCANLAAAKTSLAKAEAEWEKAGKKEDARPKASTSMLGSEEDAINHWTAQVEELEGQAKRYRETTEQQGKSGVGGVNGHTAFVTFKSRREARVSLSMQFTADRSDWVISQPTEPETLIWSDLKVSEEGKGVKRAIGYALVFGLYMAFTPFCVWVTNIADEINLGPLQSIWEVYAPTLGLLIFLSFAPTILINIFALLFNFKSDVRVQEQLQIWYFWFLFFFVILVTVVGQNFWDFLADVAENPMNFPLLLADKMPGATHYYLTFLSTQWFTHGMNLTRYIQIGKFVGLRKIWSDEEARELAEPEDQDYYGMGSRSARFTSNMLIVVIFGLISPLMAFMGFVNFFICRLFYGYLVVYAEGKKPDGGGVFFVSQMQHTFFGLFIFVVMMIGIFSTRAPTWIPMSCAVFSLALILWAWAKFNKLEWEVLPWADMVLDKTGSERVRKDSGKRYIQPELLAEAK